MGTQKNRLNEHPKNIIKLMNKTIIAILSYKICFQILSVQRCLPNSQQKRDLSIHEHLSWELLAKAGVNVPKHKVTESVAEVARITEDIGRIIFMLLLINYVLVWDKGPGSRRSPAIEMHTNLKYV